MVPRRRPWAGLPEEYALRVGRDGAYLAEEWVDQRGDHWFARLIEEGKCDR